jgi:hypothetical protein
VYESHPLLGGMKHLLVNSFFSREVRAVRSLGDPVIMRGMGIGALAGLALWLITYVTGTPWHFFRTVFWAAVIGGFAAYWPRFADLGAIITRRPEEHQRNMVIGILSLILLGSILFTIMVGGGYLLTACFPSLQ